MPKLKSFIMAKNKSYTGSVAKICSGGGPHSSSSLDRIVFGTVTYSSSKEGHPGPGNLTSSDATVYTNATGFGIPAGTCLDGSGIAMFHTHNIDQNTIVYTYVGNEMSEGPQ